MNKHQRQMIKEAYQEGYYQALDEGLGGAIRFLKNLFRGGKKSYFRSTKNYLDDLRAIDDQQVTDYLEPKFRSRTFTTDKLLRRFEKSMIDEFGFKKATKIIDELDANPELTDLDKIQTYRKMLPDDVLP